MAYKYQVTEKDIGLLIKELKLPGAQYGSPPSKTEEEAAIALEQLNDFVKDIYFFLKWIEHPGESFLPDNDFATIRKLINWLENKYEVSEVEHSAVIEKCQQSVTDTSVKEKEYRGRPPGFDPDDEHKYYFRPWSRK